MTNLEPWDTPKTETPFGDPDEPLTHTHFPDWEETKDGQ